MTLLIGNTFPVSLVRTCATMRPVSLDAARALLARADSVHSFWGHENTRSAASAVLGFELTPTCPRPALTLNPHHLPGLDGHHTDTVLILSPDYRPGYRPAIGVEMRLDQIVGWQTLLIEWK